MPTVFATPVDNASSTLAAPRSAGSTSLAVATGTGSRFGSPSTSAPIRLTLVSASALDSNGFLSDRSKLSIYLCTGRSSDTLTGLALDSGTDQDYAIGDPIAILIDAATLADIHAAIGRLEAAPDVFSSQNKDSATVAAGAPASIHASGTGFSRASAADASRPCIGLTTAAVAVGFSVPIATAGTFTLADWTAVAGASTLASRAWYYLDPATAGKLTTTVPTATGQVVQKVGYSVSPTTLEIRISGPILL